MLPTEPIGSVPRPEALLAALAAHEARELDDAGLSRAQDEALRETIARFEQTGSPIVTDGEQTKPSFATYPLAGLTNLAPDGVVIPFEDGHTRQLPRLTTGPFRYGTYGDAFVRPALRYATVPVKQAVIAISAMSLLYPADGIDGYPREQFLDDLVAEGVADIRRSLDAGARRVQIDFTEGRLSVKLDPSKGLLRQFVDLNNRVLDHFGPEDRSRIGVHTCPGGDHDSTHSADVDYAELLPSLFEMRAGAFYLQMASEQDRPRVLGIVRDTIRPDQQVFVGVIDPIDPAVETPDIVRDRVLEAAQYVPVEQLGTTDDCGFSPFADDTSTSRDIAFAKIAARVAGTEAASERLGV
jgi:5-methyltetrahydropteroyltriglutamate--homocysteine methyltransferase